METLRGLGRGWLILAVIGLLASLVLAFVPLFNLIGYESAAFFGVLYGLTVGYLSFERLSISGWSRRLGKNLLLLVAPFALLTLNALRVRNCDFGTGLSFWVMIPVLSIAIATTLGWVVRNVTGERRRLGHLIIALVSLLMVLDFGLRLALEPPIIGYHWFLGFFSGSIYDEALDLPRPLVAYRVLHMFGICAVLCTVQAWREWLAERRSTAWRLGALAALLIAVTAYGYATRQDYGIDLSRERIAEELGGVVETEHFIIYYPAQSRFIDDIDRLVEDHEYRYAEMRDYFGTDPVALRGEKVRSFVYPNRDVKGRLMGARRTLVAKIWLREIHILWRFYGDHMLAHELAHVFTEPFGTGPLRLSTRYWVFANMGLVEGIATASDWDAESLDPHEASAALRRMNKAPDITSLVGASGFWTQSSGRAYILMGSFVRWLVDTYGMDKFHQAYGHGEFESVYGKPAATLVDEWEAFVDQVELTEEQLERAEYVYDRKSIFQKVCARTIAELRLQASRAARKGDRDRARSIFETILGFDPDNVNYLVEYARFLRNLGERDEAREVLNDLLERDLDAVHRADVLAMSGDLLWLGGEADEARRKFTECLEVGVPVHSERLLTVKQLALQSTPLEQELARAYLVDDLSDGARAFFPFEWAKRYPDQPLADYLVGRRLWSSQQWKWAEPYLRRALEVQAGVLQDEAHLMLVQVLHFEQRWDEASAILESWTPIGSYYEILRDEWVRRVDWRSRNTIRHRER